jgi:hypothetical protein
MNSTAATSTCFRGLYKWLGCAAALALAAGCSGGGGGGGGGGGQVAGVEAAETAVVMGEYAMNGVAPLLDLFGGEESTPAATLGPLTRSSRLLKNLKIEKLLARQASTTAAAGVLVDVFLCPDGGSEKIYCDADATTSTVRMVADHCTEDDAGSLRQENGTVTMILNDPLVCETGTIDFGNMTAHCNSFTETVKVGGELVTRMAMNGTISRIEGPDVGCPFTGGSVSADIRLDFLSLEDEMDGTVIVNDLQVTDEVTAGTCAELITINGTLGLDDRSDGDSVRQTFSNFQVGIQEDVGGTVVTLDGQATAKCVGDVVFDTLEPLSIPTDAECPTAGLIQVTIARTAETATVRFNPDGSVDIDLGADGSVELTRATCDDLVSHGSCY